MLNRFKSWLVRKLGGYRTFYEEKIVVKDFRGEKVHVSFDLPNEFLIHIKDVETEVRRELADRFAKYIFENMPAENISVEKIYASDSVMYSANFWLEYDCDLQRRKGTEIKTTR